MSFRPSASTPPARDPVQPDTAPPYRDIVERSLEGVWVIDPAGTTTYVNQRMAAMLGYRPAEMLGRHLNAFADPAGQERAAENLQRRARGIEERHDFDLLHRDGRRVRTLMSTYPLYDAAGTHTGAVAIVSDLTDWLEAQEALARSEAKYQTLIEITRTGFVIVDGQGRVQDANAEYVRLTGQGSLEAIRGRAVTEWTAPYDIARNAAEVRQAFATGDTTALQVDYRHPDGTIVPIEINGAVIGPDRVMALCRDATERRRAETALRASEAEARARSEELAAVVAGSPLPIVAIAPDGTVTGWNPAAERTFGFSATEVIGQPLPLISDEHQEEYARFRAEVLGGRAFQGRPARRRHKDGRLLDVTISTAPLRAPDGTINGLVAIYEDVTERTRVELLRRQLQERMIEAQKLESLGVLAGGIAHDFNNLLTLMLGNAHLARTDLPPGSSAHEPLRQLEQAVMRAADLTSQMLVYAGKGTFVMRMVDLRSLVLESLPLLKATVPAGARLAVDLPPELPLIEGDPSQLRQLLSNLVTNAAEALGAAPGLLTVRLGERAVDRDFLLATLMPQELTPGHYVVLEISDDGRGMAPEVLARVFDPFFTTKFPGRGLGLAAVVGIMRRHGGTIRVSSEPGAGTTVQLLFSPARGTAAGRHDRDLAASITAPILMVDDEVDVLRLMGEFLARAGFEATLTAGGEEALARLREAPGRYRAVVLDLTMPGMPGDEALREIRALDPAIPVILASGYTEEEVGRRCAGLDFSSFLPKPYLPAELIAEIRRVIMAGHPRRDGSPSPG